MNFETGQVVIAGVFFVLGIVAHIGWENVTDWLHAQVDTASDLMQIVFTIAGAIGIAIGIGYLVTH